MFVRHFAAEFVAGYNQKRAWRTKIPKFQATPTSPLPLRAISGYAPAPALYNVGSHLPFSASDTGRSYDKDLYFYSVI